MSNDRNKIITFCSFIALLLAAVIILLNGLNVFNASFIGILTFIKDLALLVGIAFAAFAFVKSINKKAWYIVYWVSLIVYVLGAVLTII
jgi:hypothetical protein